MTSSPNHSGGINELASSIELNSTSTSKRPSNISWKISNSAVRELNRGMRYRVFAAVMLLACVPQVAKAGDSEEDYILL